MSLLEFALSFLLVSLAFGVLVVAFGILAGVLEWALTKPLHVPPKRERHLSRRQLHLVSRAGDRRVS